MMRNMERFISMERKPVIKLIPSKRMIRSALPYMEMSLFRMTGHRICKVSLYLADAG